MSSIFVEETGESIQFLIFSAADGGWDISSDDGLDLDSYCAMSQPQKIVEKLKTSSADELVRFKIPKILQLFMS